ncbi:hypothetical protein ACFQ88_34345 [Paenibacillus sp. NPDC056579]|uniref:hypothetical protein n=1 Tax=Paenibacillus sp. NPDC056579 TaxID=3345871 RepID=UPI0036D0B7FF
MPLLKGIMLLAALLFLLSPIPASANGGPLRYPAEGNGPLQFDTGSQISLVYEKVIFAIGDEAADSSYGKSADVSVHYRLRNDSAEKRSVSILFVTPSPQPVQVSSEEGALKSDSVPEAAPVNWQPKRRTDVTEPVSGELLNLSRYGWSEARTAGTRFTLAFEPGETRSVTMRYRDEGGLYDKGVINPVYSHLYYLSPAAFWKGAPEAELEVRFRDSRYKVSSNVPLVRKDTTTYQARLDGLPDTEWYFSFTSTSGLLYPTNMQTAHNSYILLASLAMLLIVAAASSYWRSRWIYASGAAAIIGFTVFYIRKIGGYPFNFIFVGAVDLFMGLVVLAVYFRLRRLWNRPK